MRIENLYERTATNPETGCLEWTGSRTRDGYGRVRYAGRLDLAHRLAFKLAYNIEIEHDQFVCHRCDNPACINVDHLFLGDAASNMLDKVRKGRQASKLTEPDVREIQKMLQSGEPQTKIASRFGVDRTTIGNIVTGRKWSWLTGNRPETFIGIYTNCGEQNSSAKLNENDVREIRKRLQCGELQANIAREFGVSPTAVYKIAHGKTWASVEIDDETSEAI